MSDFVKLSLHLAEALGDAEGVEVRGASTIAERIRLLLAEALCAIPPDACIDRPSEFMLPLLRAGSSEAWTLFRRKAAGSWTDQTRGLTDSFQISETRATLESLDGDRLRVAIVAGDIARDNDRMGAEILRIALRRDDLATATLLGRRGDLHFGWFPSKTIRLFVAARIQMQAVIARYLPAEVIATLDDETEGGPDLRAFLLAGLAMRPGMTLEAFARGLGPRADASMHQLMASRALANRLILPHLVEDAEEEVMLATA